MNHKASSLLNLNGIFPVYKYSGITSADTFTEIRKNIFKGKTNVGHIKLGHGGVLDSSACGVLAGDACQFLPSFQKGEKSYRVTGVFGIATDTYNSEGKITEEKSYDHINHSLLETHLRKYIGRTNQTPPAYSGIKIKGTHYADLARKGFLVPLVPRPVQCFEVTLIDFSPPCFTLELACGGGFYVRSLIHDIGKDLGSCAHVSFLERIRQGPFDVDSALTQENWTIKDIRMSIKKNLRTVNSYLRNLERW